MSVVKSFISKFTVLKGAPRELWLVYFQKVLEIVAYGLMSSVLILFLQNDIQMGDKTAGFYYATWSIVLTAFTVMVGPLTDTIGIKRTFVAGFILSLLSRGVMIFVTNPVLVSILGFFPLAAGHAMMVPVMTAAMKEYTSIKQRSMAFSGYYWLMNVGFLISGPIVDYVRQKDVIGDSGTWIMPYFNTPLSAYQFLFMLAFLFTIPGFIAVKFFMRDGVKVTDDGKFSINPVKLISSENKNALGNAFNVMSKAGSDTVTSLVKLWKYKSFQRFMLFVTLLVGVKLTFYHMHVTFPPYAVRTLGEGAKFGNVWGLLNPLIILILVPILGATAQKINVFKLILVGTFLSAFSIFLISFPLDFYEPLVDTSFGKFIWSTWLGLSEDTDRIVLASYIGIAIFVFIFSVGEAIWSPKLYEYTAQIAPEGKTASYMSLSLIPMFAAKFFAGSLSGVLLDIWCPKEGDRSNAYLIWVFVGVMAAFAPIGILILKNVINPKIKDVENYEEDNR